MMDVKRSQRSVRSRAIFDEDRLAEYRAELVRNDAANRVAPAARPNTLTIVSGRDG